MGLIEGGFAMLTFGHIVSRLILAAFLGSVVGFERERLDKAAGLRTHMLVCVGAALTMVVSAYGFNEVLGRHATVLDPSRIAAQVVSGIGFLGAGIIILRRDVIVGLTTAAGIWAIAAVGLAVGGGLYLQATAATALIIAVIAAIRPIERKLRANGRKLYLTLAIDRNITMSELGEAVHTANAIITGLKVEPSEESSDYKVNLTLDSLPINRALAVVDQLTQVSGVHKVEIAG